MKSKKMISFIISLIVICSASSCSQGVVKKVAENGELNQQNLPQAQIDPSTDNTIPTYDTSELPSSTTLVSKEELSSYYIRKLNQRSYTDYNDIKNAANNFESEVLLTKPISSEELFQIMAIINLDDPILFQLASKYSYNLDDSGYVNKVYLSYSMSKNEYTSKYSKVLDRLQNMYSKINVSDQDTALTSKKSGTEYNVEQVALSLIRNLNCLSSNSDSTVADDSLDMFSSTKLFNLYGRYVGLDCAIKIGQPINTDEDALLSHGGYYYDSLSDIDKYTYSSGNRYTVDFDFNNYCCWNVVKIENNWYNLDISLNELTREEYKEGLTKQQKSYEDKLDNFYFTQNTNDYFMSMSKMSYMSDELLGLSPACTSIDFMNSYRNGNLVLSMSSTQMMTYLSQEIAAYTPRTSLHFYQFEDENTYDLFVSNFDEQIKSYSEAHNNSILSYSSNKDRKTLSVIVYDLKFKE